VNFHLGQEGDALNIDIRTGASGLETTDEVQVPGIFAGTDQQRIIVRFTRDQVDVFVGGALVHEFSTDNRTLADWDVTYPVVIGDERTGERTFDGTIDSVEFHTRALSNEETAALSR
jgi:hypothetical protein